MKYIAALFTTLFLASAGFCDSTEEAIDTWRIVKNAPFLSSSADFDFKSGNSSIGRVVRTGLFCPHYYYDLYDAHQEFQVRGITRAFSWGFLFPWGMEIDLYDQASIYIGSIRGQVVTKARAKFIFYGPDGETRSIVYLNNKKASLVIVSPLDESIIQNELNGEVYGDVSRWTVKINKELTAVDDSLLKVFSAFIADYDDSFQERPKIVYHYHFHNNP